MEHKNGLEDCYVIKDHKRLRCGYTTGSCAAAAAKAAVWMLLTGRTAEEAALMTPKGILLHLLVEDGQIRRGAGRPSGGSPLRGAKGRRRRSGRHPRSAHLREGEKGPGEGA